MNFKGIREHIASIKARDPAARSEFEILLLYPGFHAVLIHGLARRVWSAGFPVFARFFSQLAKFFTGVEIHPAATIGKNLFIDHATGVVIGETAVIGDNVTLYQGVTLGGTSLHKGKRHPTLEDDVIVGSGAQILGPITVGAGARVGANAVVLQDVPKGMTVVGIPARVAVQKAKPEDIGFCAYGLSDDDDVPDPVARNMDAIRKQVASLLARIEELEGRVEGTAEADGGAVVGSLRSERSLVASEEGAAVIGRTAKK